MKPHFRVKLGAILPASKVTSCHTATALSSLYRQHSDCQRMERMMVLRMCVCVCVSWTPAENRNHSWKEPLEGRVGATDWLIDWLIRVRAGDFHGSTSCKDTKREIKGKGTDLPERTAGEGGDQDTLTVASLTAMRTIDHCRLRHLGALRIEKSNAYRLTAANGCYFLVSCVIYLFWIDCSQKPPPKGENCDLALCHRLVAINSYCDGNYWKVGCKNLFNLR